MQDTVFTVLCQRQGRAMKYGIAFPYNQQLIDRIKLLPFEERKFDGINKIWVLSIKSLYDLIKSYKGSVLIKFEFIGNNAKEIFKELVVKIYASEKEKEDKLVELENKKKEWLEFKVDLEINWEQYSEAVHKNLKEGVKLYPHQVQGVIYGNKIENILYAVEMGGGKTGISIALCELREFKKVLVITPKSLMFNYYYETEKFSNSKAHIVNWKHNPYTIEESKYIIVNYDFFNPSDKRKFDLKWKKLGLKHINALVSDECQRLKNTENNIYNNYKRTIVNSLFENEKRFTMFMSGTPNPNKNYELYSVLNQINSLEFKTKTHFYNYYCGMTYDPNGFGYAEDESKTNFDELYLKIRPYLFRKKLQDVIKGMPDISFQKIMLELDDKEQKVYDEIEGGIANEFTTTEVNNPLTKMIRLRQYTSNAKIKYACEFIDNILETQNKLVIFDVYKDSLYQLHEKYKKYSCLHTGDQSVEERSELVRLFQDVNSDKKIFLTTYASGNFGLTLTASHLELLLALPFVPGEYKQAAFRVFRIGQKNNVIIYPFVFRNTIDEYVFETLESKTREIVKVMDNENYEPDTNETVLGSVVNKIKEKHKK